MERTVQQKRTGGRGGGGRRVGRRGKPGEGAGRGGAERSYYGNTHARTRVSRFLWRAGSLDGYALWRTVAQRDRTYKGH